jgi:hypothetical protein
MLVKISTLYSVNVIYLRSDHKLIPIFFINKRRERMYWEGSGKISKLKNNFLQVTIAITHHDSNNLLLHPVILYIAYTILCSYGL